ncbi:MAG: hypothetical protein V4733_10650 [Verrucomicrobiota bacterium]
MKSARGKRGAALIAVLWLIAVLGIACMAALRVVSFDMQIATAKIHGARARQVAEMGIAVACNPAVKRTDPLLRRADEEALESYEARIHSEGGRFNINALVAQEDKSLIREVLIGWGLTLDEAQEVSDALGDWVDGDDETALNGIERDGYEKMGRVNQPFNRPFYDLAEVRLVRGMERVEALRPDWRSWFTIWSGGGLDLNEAAPELIAAAAGCTVEQASVIPETVRGSDGELDTDDDARFQDAASALALIGVDINARPDLAARFSVNDPTNRIESVGSTGGAKVKITVIIRNRTGRPLLLQRNEEIIP